METKKRDAKIQEAKMQENVNQKSGVDTLNHQLAGAPESGKLRSSEISAHRVDVKSVPHKDEIRADPKKADVSLNNPAGFPKQVKSVANTPTGYTKKVEPVVSTPAVPVMK
jgi:hypothetical protein